MKILLFSCTAIVAIIAAPAVFAAQPSSPATPSSSGTAAVQNVASSMAIKARIDKLKDQIQLVKLQNELAKELNAGKDKGKSEDEQNNAGQGQNTKQVTRGLPAVLQAPQQSGALVPLNAMGLVALPQVTMISGVGKKLQARLRYADGGVLTVERGDSLGANYKVVEITRSGVVVQSGDGKRIPLRFGGAEVKQDRGGR